MLFSNYTVKLGLFLLLCVVMAGNVVPAEINSNTNTAEKKAAPTPAQTVMTSGNRQVSAYQFGKGETGILIIAGIKEGDTNSAEIANQLVIDLNNQEPTLFTGSVTVIPCLNPDGTSGMAKNFPKTAGEQQITSAEINFAVNAYNAQKPKLVVIIGEGAAAVTVDGKAETSAQTLANTVMLPLVPYIGVASKGSSDYYFYKLGKTPVIRMETPAGKAEYDRYKNGLMALCGVKTSYQAPANNKMVTKIVISKKVNRLAAFNGDELLMIFPVATGKNFSTPPGTYKVHNRAKHPGLAALGTRWMGLSKWGSSGKQYGIHGTNQPRLIGQYVSHGCIRMQNKDAETLYDFVSVGTEVVITNDDLPATAYHPKSE